MCAVGMRLSHGSESGLIHLPGRCKLVYASDTALSWNARQAEGSAKMEPGCSKPLPWPRDLSNSNQSFVCANPRGA